MPKQTKPTSKPLRAVNAYIRSSVKIFILKNVFRKLIYAKRWY